MVSRIILWHNVVTIAEYFASHPRLLALGPMVEQGRQRVPRSYVTATNQSPIHWEVALAPASASRLLMGRFRKVDTEVRQKGVDTM